MGMTVRSHNTTFAGLNFIPYDKDKVITGNPNQWFNPLMFTLPPLTLCPGSATVTCGQLGNAARNSLRGPGRNTWDLSLNKDTRLGFLGEQGTLQFRAEFFNLLNHANFFLPNATAFNGTAQGIGAVEAPVSTAGQITSTSTPSRQIQLALKVIF